MINAQLDLTSTSEESRRIRKKYNIQSLPTLVILPDPKRNIENQEQMRGYVSTQMLLRKIAVIKKEN